MKIVCAIGFGGLTEMYWSCQYLSIDPKKSLPHNHILRSRVGGAFPFRFAVCISAFPFGPFSRVTAITRYSAKGTKGKWRYASSKARLKFATYP